MFKALAVAVVAFLFAGVVCADDLPTYDVTGSFEVTGQNLCSGQCNETLNVSFEVSYVLNQTYDMYVADLSNSTYSATGTLGNFSGNGPTGTLDANLTNPPIEYLLGADEIDLFLANSEQPDPLPLLPPGFGSDYIYNCSSSACAADFSDGGMFVGPGAMVGHGPGEFTSTLVPEPGVLPMLLFGLLILIAGKAWLLLKRQAASPSRTPA